MSKLCSIDYSKLADNIYKRAYRFSDVKDQIERVAFDIVRFKDNDKGADLWQIQNADDGDYIVALYNEESVVKESNWEVTLNKLSSNIQISYKGDPIVKIPSNKLGIPSSELKKIEEYLPSKLAENKKLVKMLLNELSASVKSDVLSKYHELS